MPETVIIRGMGSIDSPYIIDSSNNDKQTKFVNLKLNGSLINFDSPAFIENNRTFVPMRKIFEALNAEVKWDEATKKALAVKGDFTVSLQIGKNTAIVNNKEILLDAVPKILNGRTLVPLRFIVESLGAKVEWDKENNCVLITEVKEIPNLIIR